MLDGICNMLWDHSSYVQSTKLKFRWIWRSTFHFVICCGTILVMLDGFGEIHFILINRVIRKLRDISTAFFFFFWLGLQLCFGDDQYP